MRTHRLLRGVAPGLVAVLLCACAAEAPQNSADAALTRAVEKNLAADSGLGAPNQVYVRTLNGTVYLSGKVTTDLQRNAAEQIARRTAGVDQVVNTIALEYSGR